MEFVKNFTPLDFQAKNFTPSISPNFNSFSKKKHKKWVKMEKFTPLAKILHCRRQWREWQIPPLQGGSTIVPFYVFCTVHTYPFIASWSVKKQSPMLWVLSLFVWPLSFNFLLLLISKETVTNVVKEARPIGQQAFPPSARLSRQSENSDDHLQEAGPIPDICHFFYTGKIFGE